MKSVHVDRVWGEKQPSSPKPVRWRLISKKPSQSNTPKCVLPFSGRVSSLQTPLSSPVGKGLHGAGDGVVRRTWAFHHRLISCRVSVRHTNGIQPST